MMAFGGRNVGPFQKVAFACLVIWMSGTVIEAAGIRTHNFTSSKVVDATKLFIPALVILGDSTVDAGNNNYLTTIVKSDFVPYGMNFEGGVPTGRFTNGMLSTDYVCKPMLTL